MELLQTLPTSSGNLSRQFRSEITASKLAGQSEADARARYNYLVRHGQLEEAKDLTGEYPEFFPEFPLV